MKTAAQSYKDIAQRIKHTRWMTGLNQHEFAEKFRFSIHTLQSLELGRLPLSLKTALRLCDCFRNAGLFCTPTWLLSGEGSPPQHDQLTLQSDASQIEGFFKSEDLIVSEEIATFQRLNKGAIVIRVEDDAMLPLYQPGDYIGGRRLKGPDVDTLLDKNCIVEIKKHDFIPRHFTKRPHSNTYILSALNPATTSPMPLIEADKVVSAALILWHRRLHH